MKYDRSTLRMLAMFSQFGIHMLVPIFLCSFLGIFIDKKLGTSYWMVILFFVGALAGYRNVYRLAKRLGEKQDLEALNERSRRKNKKH